MTGTHCAAGDPSSGALDDPVAILSIVRFALRVPDLEYFTRA